MDDDLVERMKAIDKVCRLFDELDADGHKQAAALLFYATIPLLMGEGIGGEFLIESLPLQYRWQKKVEDFREQVIADARALAPEVDSPLDIKINEMSSWPERFD